jgi:hypothetical protein
MPNETVYVDEKTPNKVMRALNKAGLDFDKSLDVVETIQDAGLLFREPRRKDVAEVTEQRGLTIQNDTPTS